MKLYPKHFTFEVFFRKIMAESWKEYFEVKNKKEKTDYDKFYLQEYRKQIKEHEFKVVVTHNPTKIKSEYIVPAINRHSLMDSTLSSLRTVRLKSKELTKERKEFDGAVYNRVGGVMDWTGLKNIKVDASPINALGKLLKTNDPMFYKKPRTTTKNYVGIELEFLRDDHTGHDIYTIGEVFKAKCLGKYVRVTTDASCGFEVQVLLEENDVENTLPKIIKVLVDLGFRVDERCGTHIHLDMRSRDVKQVYKNFFMTQNFLKKFLHKSRKKNRYCKLNSLPTFDEQLKLKDMVDYDTYRRHAINVDAYNKHRTLEIRMYQGCLNYKALIPWIKLLLKIANFKGELAEKVFTFKQASKVYEFETDLSTNLKDRLVDMAKKEVV